MKLLFIPADACVVVQDVPVCTVYSNVHVCTAAAGQTALLGVRLSECFEPGKHSYNRKIQDETEAWNCRIALLNAGIAQAGPKNYPGGSG